MRISDWSSDVCSSDLALARREQRRQEAAEIGRRQRTQRQIVDEPRDPEPDQEQHQQPDRQLDDPAAALADRIEEMGPVRLDPFLAAPRQFVRSEEHKSELQSLMRIPYDVFCLKKKITTT